MNGIVCVDAGCQLGSKWSRTDFARQCKGCKYIFQCPVLQTTVSQAWVCAREVCDDHHEIRLGSTLQLWLCWDTQWSHDCAQGFKQYRSEHYVGFNHWSVTVLSRRDVAGHRQLVCKLCSQWLTLNEFNILVVVETPTPANISNHHLHFKEVSRPHDAGVPWPW